MPCMRVRLRSVFYRGWLAFLAVMAALLTGAGVDAGAVEGPKSGFRMREATGTATLFLTGWSGVRDLPSALAVAAVLQAGDDGRPDGLKCWSLRDTDQVRPFPAAYLAEGYIRDGHGIHVGTLETGAYFDVVVMAHYTSAAAFRKAARRDLTYTQVFADPSRYRGQVLHFEGRLKRLARLEPPDEVQAQGVTDLYEAWIFSDAYGLNPFCALFTNLPPELADLVGENKIKGSVEVSFDGYFYKKIRYKAADSKESTARDAPVFIGHTLAVRSLPQGATESDNWGNGIMAVFLGIIGLAVVTVVGLTWWFRRTDRRVRRRLAARQNAELILPPAESSASDFPGPAR